MSCVRYVGRSEWEASIGYKGEKHRLYTSVNKSMCEKIAKLADKAKENNTLDDFLVKLRKKKQMERGVYR